MGLLDSLKNAASTLSSAASKVNVSPAGGAATQGQELHVAVSAMPTGHEIKVEGVYVDVIGTETLSLNGVSTNAQTVKVTTKIAGPGTIAPDKGGNWIGSIKIPPELPPTYAGPHAKHEVALHGRVDVAGNDLQSGPQPLIVLRKLA